MGYIIVLIMGVLLLVVAIVAVGRNKRPKQGRISSEGTAILRDQPSADEPTPGRSVTAPPSVARNAGRHTPPA